jgi:PPK2 family polyphosphate:nucleotide phosphotransferase
MNKNLGKRAIEFARPYRVDDGSKFKLDDHDPGDTANLDSEVKPAAKEALQEGIELLSDLQEMLYAQDRWAVLLIFQAMDAAGKDGAIKHVMSGVNPQGVQVASFKAPSSEELDHDYLWRCQRHLPERGRIGIFNRSYYEEVLVVRVHEDLLKKQKLPERLVTKDIWKHRYKDIRGFERYLARNGVAIRKFFLNLSRDEQKKRFLARLEDKEKHWKFSVADAHERGYWNDYMRAYEQMIQETATEYAPWYVVPADNKWFSRLVVASGTIEAMCSLDLDFPKVSDEQHAELEQARARLLAED